ncbi:MAG: NAD(P)H-dependent oxidoreductase [Aeromicrobium sp.]
MTARVVAVSGSLRAGSTTTALLRGILDEIAARREISADVVELSTFAPDLAAAVVGGPASPALSDALAAVADADVLVVATPVYRGSYTGLFKLFIDLVPQDALAGTPVLLAAGGGNDQHALVIDHELRPLFAFFRAEMLPVGVYARASDYADGEISSDSLRTRIADAVAAAAPALSRT